MRSLSHNLVLIASLTWSGCATIPAAAPTLSSELSGRIQESRRAHLDAVHLYMDSRRRQIDDFVEREWIPSFARDVLQQPNVAAVFNEAASTTDLAKRFEVIVGLGTRLQRQINQKRQELITPLDQAEVLITRRLEEHYNEILAMNSTLTGLLAAGAKATETQQRITRYLDPEQKLPGYLDVADNITSELLQKADDAEKQSAKVKALLDQLRQRR